MTDVIEGSFEGDVPGPEDGGAASDLDSFAEPTLDRDAAEHHAAEQAASEAEVVAFPVLGPETVAPALVPSLTEISGNSDSMAPVGQVAARRFGGAIGAAAAPGAVYAVWWSGVGPADWYVWVLVAGVGAILGALTWPIFVVTDAQRARPSVTFAAVFGGTLGMLAGTLVAFPIAGVFGLPAGALGGAACALMWRVSGLNRRGTSVRSGVAALVGGLAGLAGTAGWLA